MPRDLLPLYCRRMANGPAEDGRLMIDARPDCKTDSTGYGPATGAEPVGRPRHFRTQIIAKPRLSSERREIGMSRHAAIGHQQILLGNLSEDFQMPGRGRMQAQHHEATLGPQFAEEVEHEADIAVLEVELRLVEQMHYRRRCRRLLEQ